MNVMVMKENMKSIPLFQRTDFILIAVLLFIAGLIFLWSSFSSEGMTAVVTLDGETVTEIKLESAEDEIFTVGSVTVEVKDGKISVTDSDCPDKTCVKTGLISKNGEASVCVPNKVAVKIEGERAEDDFDILSY